MTPTLRQRVLHRIRSANTPAENDSGFTLVEVLVSLVVVSIVMAGAVTGLAAFAKSSDDTRSRTAASNLAQQDLQQLRSITDRSKVAAMTATTRQVGSRSFTISRAVTFTNAAGATVSGPCPVSHLTGYSPSAVTVVTTVSWGGRTPSSVAAGTRLAC